MMAGMTPEVVAEEEAEDTLIEAPGKGMVIADGTAHRLMVDGTDPVARRTADLVAIGLTTEARQSMGAFLFLEGRAQCALDRLLIIAHRLAATPA